MRNEKAIRPVCELIGDVSVDRCFGFGRGSRAAKGAIGPLSGPLAAFARIERADGLHEPRRLGKFPGLRKALGLEGKVRLVEDIQNEN